MTLSNWNRLLAFALIAAIASVLVWYFSDIVGYVLLAWALSMLGEPLMDFFQKFRFKKWRVGRSLAAVLVILTYFLIFGGLLVLFVPPIVEQGKHLAELDYQALGKKLEGPLGAFDGRLHEVGLLRGEESLGGKAQELFQKYFSPNLLSDWARGFVATAGNVVVTFSSTLFILFYFLKEKGLFGNMIHALVPQKQEEKVVHALDESSRMLSRYFGGLFLQMLGFSALVSAFLWLMGVKSALLIGAFGGLMNLVPYVGPILGAVFGLFITVSSGLDMDFYAELLPALVKVAAAFSAAQVIDNFFLQPAIFSSSVSAHPLEIFIVTMIGAKLGGVGGMVLAIPTYTVGRVVLRTFFNEFKLVQALTERMDETGSDA